MTTLPSPPVRAADLDARDTPRRREGVAAPLVLGVLLALAAVLAAFGPARVGGVASDLFAAYVAAQQKMLQAAGNITADGRAEFAVLLHDPSAAAAFRDAVARLDGVTVERAADLPGWMIVTTEAGDRAGLDAVLALPEARVVMPNRGLWICH